MSAWRGADGAYIVDGMPHVTKIIRKPEGVGCEMKATADGTTGIMMRLELQEGKERMQLKQFQLRPNSNHAQDPNYLAEVAAGNVFPFNTAVTLRLSLPFHGTGRTVIGDSAFASVPTLMQSHQRGFYFIGLVKTASRDYPKAILQEWSKTGGDGGQPPAHGSHKVLTSTYMINGLQHTMMAVGWMDKTLKTIISNCGTTLAGTPSMRERHHIVNDPVTNAPTTHISTKVIQRPQIVRSYSTPSMQSTSMTWTDKGS